MAVKALQNITITYDGDSLEEHLSQASLEAVIAEIDVTVLSSAAGEKIAGLGNWSVPVSGFWSSTLDGYLAPDAVSPPSTLKTLVVVIGPSGSQVTFTWTANAFLSNYRINADNPGGAITWTGTLSVSGNPVRS
jgi:hypothetical protein